MKTNEVEVMEMLAGLGMTRAADGLKLAIEKKRKLAIAYEHFRYVRKDKIADFQQKLKEKTIRRDGGASYFQILSFTPVAEYGKVPPKSVLDSFRAARDKGCFDSFLIAHIEEVKDDPILFGCVSGCSDLFFIDQWDKDVSIEDILLPNEG